MAPCQDGQNFVDSIDVVVRLGSASDQDSARYGSAPIQDDADQPDAMRDRSAC